jgi:hypothetical protein
MGNRGNLNKMDMIRLILPICILFTVLLSIYSCKKENKDRIARIKIVNNTGFAIDSLEVFGTSGNEYSHKYYNINIGGQTQEEILYNANCIVRFKVHQNSITMWPECNPSGIYDPSPECRLMSGRYIFYLIPPDSLNNYNSVAFTYKIG